MVIRGTPASGIEGLPEAAGEPDEGLALPVLLATL